MTDRCHPSFRKILGSFNELNIETHSAPVYGLWKDLTLAYFNPAWFTFAKENHGEPAISSEWKLGRNVLESVTRHLKAFYADFFQACLEDGRNQSRPYQLVYECSSAETFRKYLMTLYALRRDEGLLVVNALVQERPRGPSALKEPQEIRLSDIYSDKNGIIHQCAHCRKVKNVKHQNRWDWVSECVDTVPPNIRHDLCPFCFDYYYPAARDSKAL
ncbi:MAG TPA: hypothetical protein PKK23_18580 [Nitrospirales bacterium]|nr:hypothetical protein [Nitrospiraceae bacterium]HNP31058.1 hypothetical protein [Nitrospirales bacterium]